MIQLVTRFWLVKYAMAELAPREQSRDTLAGDRFNSEGDVTGGGGSVSSSPKSIGI
jgi:hypothetical protein